MGVKSLWNLLAPVGRPIMLEAIEGNVLAIDSSIWIYQFQATMRGKDGRALVNAHILGFLRRICKLLFYGIKPVFVFDGGAPALKRATIIERKKKKTSATESHARLAERLFAAQMRREAISAFRSSKSAKGKGKEVSGPAIIDDDTVYLEDIDPTMQKTPAKKGKAKDKDPSSTSPKKNRFHDHDPYRLPDVDLETVVAQATRSAIPDPRMATEDELRAFIEEMKPEDFDVTSPAFRELPTEVQYEIIGDLRLKSRQTSYKRLQNMLRNAPTPLDFSREQIKHLKERNALTQQLLTTTDSIGKAHISIPVRIASERNKEYLLIKNEGEGGGWILGVRDEGTAANPIQIDQDNESGPPGEDSNDDMEEISIPTAVAPDPDLREYRREMALSAVSKRYSPKKLAPLTTKSFQSKPKSTPLFVLDDEDFHSPVDDIKSDDDIELAVAIQESLDHDSRASQSTIRHTPITPTSFSPSPHDSGTGRYPVSPILAETVPSSSAIAEPPIQQFHNRPSVLDFPDLRTPPEISPSPSPDQASNLDVKVITAHARLSPSHPTLSPDSDSDDMEEVISSQHHPVLESSGPSQEVSDQWEDADVGSRFNEDDVLGTDSQFDHPQNISSTFPSQETPNRGNGPSEGSSPPIHPRAESDDGTELDLHARSSRSPEPALGPSSGSLSHSTPLLDPVDWDAAQEMDPEGEEGEFARFLSQVKGKDLDDVRREIDDEIQALNQQKKAAMRDADDITQQMISQIMIMLRLFGIPYITAPMEAEAQCAALASLGLVDGIITDDSDVFLFGGARVLKNMFNQSKTVECFFAKDLIRDLGLDRETLIRLAYLLGSDYVDGLPGVGPVVAMELLKEFPGGNGLIDFKNWWSKVQTGKDKDEESATKLRKNFKKKFKELYLPNEWPNPAVREAYLCPAVDESDEPFKWGLPDLDALRHFLDEELGWSQTKVDDLLLPIIQKMGKRSQKGAMNKQGNLSEYLGGKTGSGLRAPRKQQAYASKRLQKVVSEFRAGQANTRGKSSAPESAGSDPEYDDQEDVVEKAIAGKRKRQTRNSSTRVKTSKKRRPERKADRSSSDAASDSEFDSRSGVSRGPLRFRLRPRPKPADDKNSATE